MKAKDIPEGRTVTKVTGSAEYTIRTAITIYGPGGRKKVIKADEGTRFLVSNKGWGNISAIDENKELAVELNEYDLQKILEGGEAQ